MTLPDWVAEYEKMTGKKIDVEQKEQTPLSGNNLLPKKIRKGGENVEAILKSEKLGDIIVHKEKRTIRDKCFKYGDGWSGHQSYKDNDSIWDVLDIETVLERDSFMEDIEGYNGEKFQLERKKFLKEKGFDFDQDNELKISMLMDLCLEEMVIGVRNKFEFTLLDFPSYKKFAEKNILFKNMTLYNIENGMSDNGLYLTVRKVEELAKNKLVMEKKYKKIGTTIEDFEKYFTTNVIDVKEYDSETDIFTVNCKEYGFDGFRRKYLRELKKEQKLILILKLMTKKEKIISFCDMCLQENIQETLFRMTLTRLGYDEGDKDDTMPDDASFGGQSFYSSESTKTTNTKSETFEEWADNHFIYDPTVKGTEGATLNILLASVPEHYKIRKKDISNYFVKKYEYGTRTGLGKVDYRSSDRAYRFRIKIV